MPVHSSLAAQLPCCRSTFYHILWLCTDRLNFELIHFNFRALHLGLSASGASHVLDEHDVRCHPNHPIFQTWRRSPCWHGHPTPAPLTSAAMSAIIFKFCRLGTSSKVDIAHHHCIIERDQERGSQLNGLPNVVSRCLVRPQVLTQVLDVSIDATVKCRVARVVWYL